MTISNEELNRIWKNRFADLNERPENCSTEEWKNRFRVSAKLAEKNYLSAFILFTRKKLSWSSGINSLIASNPEIQQIQKELKNDA